MKYYKVIYKEVKLKLPKGISYRKLSALTGIDHSYIYRIIKKDLMVSEKTAKLLIKVIKES